MKKIAVTYAGILVALLVSFHFPSTGMGEDSKTGTQQNKPLLKRLGHVQIDEDVWYRFHDEPPLHMQRAREGFIKREFAATSRELHKAGGYLHAAASQADDDLKTMLHDSAEELDQLSDSVKTGTVDSVTRLENAFARAEHALAIHNQRMAQRAMERADSIRSGQYLRTAVQNAENSAHWAGHKLESGSQKVLDTGRTLAGKMIETPGFVVQESSKGIIAVGAELQLFGKWLEPRRITGKPIRKTN